jgi:hypothetical protein
MWALSRVARRGNVSARQDRGTLAAVTATAESIRTNVPKRLERRAVAEGHPVRIGSRHAQPRRPVTE